MVNIFNEAQLEKRKKTFNQNSGLKPGDKMEVGNVRIQQVEKAEGRLDGYMYNDYRKWDDFPVMLFDDVLVMSVTPLEIASHYKIIEKAKGKVGVGGLGLGYFIQNILHKKEVENVTVYENNMDVILMYEKLFGIHRKLKLCHGDVGEITGKTFDVFYCDIYPVRLMEQVILDYFKINKQNCIREYYFWGVEEFVMSVVARENNIDSIRLFPNCWNVIAVELYGDLNSSSKSRKIDLKADCSELVELFEKGGEQ